MKKVYLALTAFLLLLTLTVSAAAYGTPPPVDGTPLLYDEAGLLTDSEAASVESRLSSVSSKQNADIIVLTVNSMSEYGFTGTDISKYFAAEFFDQNGYGRGSARDGAILVVAMAEREYNIVTSGFGITAITDYGREWLFEKLEDSMVNGDYDQAFKDFADYTDALFDRARAGDPFDVYSDKEPVKPFSLKRLIGSVVAGLLGGLVPVSSMKSKLKSVRGQSGARSYAKPDSLTVTQANDFFIGRHVSRTPRQTERTSSGGSSTFHSSSGHTFGGGSGHKF